MCAMQTRKGMHEFSTALPQAITSRDSSSNIHTGRFGWLRGGVELRNVVEMGRTHERRSGGSDGK
jgi:hypothetical protein